MDMYVRRVIIQVVGDSHMAQHHTLGTSCRARGINKVREVFWTYLDIRILVVLQLCLASLIDVINQNDLLSRIGCCMVGGRDDILRLRIVHNQIDAVSGISWVARDIGCTSLADTKHAHNDSTGTWQQQYHTIAMFNAFTHQGMSHLIGFGIQFCKGQGAVLGNESLTVRILDGIILNRFVEQMIGHLSLGSKAEGLHSLALLVVEHAQVHHQGLGVCHHVLGSGLNGFCHTLQVLTAVQRVTRTQADIVLTIAQIDDTGQVGSRFASVYLMCKSLLTIQFDKLLHLYSLESEFHTAAHFQISAEVVERICSIADG